MLTQVPSDYFQPEHDPTFTPTIKTLRVPLENIWPVILLEEPDMSENAHVMVNLLLDVQNLKKLRSFINHSMLRHETELLCFISALQLRQRAVLFAVKDRRSQRSKICITTAALVQCQCFMTACVIAWCPLFHYIGVWRSYVLCRCLCA